MPTDNWQTIVALLAVAGAAWFLVRRAVVLYRASQKSGSACGSCGSCAAGKSDANGAPAVIVALENFAPDNEEGEFLGVDLPNRDAT